MITLSFLSLWCYNGRSLYYYIENFENFFAMAAATQNIHVKANTKTHCMYTLLLLTATEIFSILIIELL